MKIHKLTLAVAAACTLSPSFTIAQETDSQTNKKEIETIIVSSTKRSTTLQEIPFSVNAQTSADIERSGSNNLEDVSRNIAGLSIQNLGPGQSQVAIRGVSAGQIVRDQPGVKEQVGIYLDESVISLSLFTPDIDLYDLNRIETLRGPQGTLFGSGSIGGTVRYITNQPQLSSFEGSLELNAHSVTDGGLGGHVKGMVNAPLSDTAAIRGVFYTTEYAGFIDALGENNSRKEDINDGSRTGGRVAIKWQPTDNISITPRLVFQKLSVNGFNRDEIYNLFANPFTTERPAIKLKEREQYLLLDEGFEDETLIADITSEWNADFADVTFVYSYTDRDILVSRDVSALSGSVSLDLGLADAAVKLPSNLRDSTKVKQDTYELRFASNKDSQFEWLVGGFYSDTQRNYSQRLPTPGYDQFTDAALGDGTAESVSNGFEADSPYNARLPYDLSQLSIFGEASYQASDKLKVTFGSRYYDYEETRSFKTGGLFSNSDEQTDSTASDGFNSRIIASYQIDQQISLNAQVSQGFRLGGVNDPLNETLCNEQDSAVFGGFQDYDDEKLTNYEVGFKAKKSFWTANVALFHTQIDGLQVTLDAGSCSSRISFNVPDSHTTGVEFEFESQATDYLNLSLAGSYISAEFDSTILDSNGEVIGGVKKGNRLASVPELQLAFAGTYDLPTSLFGSDATYLNASLQYVGDRITQPSDQVAGAGVFSLGVPYAGASGNEETEVDLTLDAYQTLNINAGFLYDDWDVLVYINNITDENTKLSFDRERGGRARLAYRVGQPRTIGITLRKSFY
ncbi:TonB-dependent receptor [Catenovulum adriaticum]|uniref:TonB-dependent receptor n=1 Tax=Catenovulum adriaticum TaxID=2984846 RepID=A0ABY7AJ05_9ALTE|nr:TonB-dependent receptor [Catenovulum sp. TS8]WAJ69479.1 TonB-dependent receptor [Catenovulum sp. TS8]